MQRIRGKLRKSILRSTKVQGNWGELINTFLRQRKVQGKCRETGGKLQKSNTLLRQRQVEGNCRETGSKLKKYIFQAQKSAGKLG